MGLRLSGVAIGAFAMALAVPALAQSGMDRGWGDMGRSGEYYDFRDPGPDRNYDRYGDDLRDRGDRGYPRYEREYRGRNGPDDWARNWYDEHRDWFRADRGDGDYRDRGWGDMGRSSEYYDFRDPGPDRRYDRYRDSLRDRDWRQGRAYDIRSRRDSYSYRYDSPDADHRLMRERGYGGYPGGDDYMASDDRPGFGDMDVPDHARWNQRSYRGTANRAIAD